MTDTGRASDQLVAARRQLHEIAGVEERSEAMFPHRPWGGALLGLGLLVSALLLTSSLAFAEAADRPGVPLVFLALGMIGMQLHDGFRERLGVRASVTARDLVLCGAPLLGFVVVLWRDERVALVFLLPGIAAVILLVCLVRAVPLLRRAESVSGAGFRPRAPATSTTRAVTAVVGAVYACAPMLMAVEGSGLLASAVLMVLTAFGVVASRSVYGPGEVAQSWGRGEWLAYAWAYATGCGALAAQLLAPERTMTIAVLGAPVIAAPLLWVAARRRGDGHVSHA